MKYFMYAIFAAAVAFSAGCTPKLANRELGPEEQEWKEYIEEMYPGWTMPGTLPPGISENDNGKDFAANGDDGFGLNDVKDSVPADKAVKDNADSSLAAVSNEPEISKVRYEDYTVEKNDTLSHIAKKVYGNGRKFYRILKANEDVVKNPNRIYPGMKLRIPRP